VAPACSTYVDVMMKCSTGLFEVFDNTKVAMRVGTTSDVRCLHHGDLTFDLQSGEHVNLVLNLSSAHRVVGEVDDVASAPAPVVGSVTIMPPHHRFKFDVVGQCRVVALRLPMVGRAGLRRTSDKAQPDMSLRPCVNADDPALTRLIFTTAAAVTPAEQQQGLVAIGRYLVATPRRPTPRASQGPARGGIPEARLRRVMQKLLAKLDAPVTLGAMADEAGMSVYHFARAFAATTGWPPHRFLLRQRVHRAVELLGDRNLSVGDIAEGLGFSHHSHLSRTMRRLIGLSPDMLRSRLLI
jgi:AraC family transcriptional regulator